MQKSVQQPMAWLVLLATGHRRRWTLHGLGSFQKVLYLVCAYQSISCGIHYLSSVLMSIIPEHACKPPGMVRKAVFHNVSAWRLEDILALRSPEHKGHIMVELQDGEIWELTRCSRMWRENTSHLGYEYSGYKRDSPCSDGYVYDQSKWRNSVVKSFNLVCDQKWYASIIQPLFIFGVLLGSITFSYLSDRFGRRLALWCTSIGVFFFGIASLFIFDYFSFMVVRFFLVTAASGYFVVVFVYVMEIIGKKSRTWASMQLNTFFAIGAMLVALASYLVSTWWLYQITLCILTSPFIMCCWMLPETPFWLLSEGRYKEAQGTVDAMAVWNQSRSCDLVELLSLDMTRSPDKSPKGVRKHRLADLFYNLDVAKMTLIVWLGWFTANLGYYLFTMEAIRRKENEPLYLLLVELQDCEKNGSFGCQNCYRLRIRLYLSLYGRAVSNNCKVLGCREQQHGVPRGKHGHPAHYSILQSLDLPATDFVWDPDHTEWTAVTEASRNPEHTNDIYLGDNRTAGHTVMERSNRTSKEMFTEQMRAMEYPKDRLNSAL
ncbi:solute carrier family 22 member 16 isoform X8 [Mastomys coucha]|uniref:solute carrier family 22 member 16 isoform X8 n=1 Tax=Mastomys coucha TaxID=35658 RepID=UPI0012622CB0|nr:solute carrier family 22 member 16 isoform X8 [Mastomys coucha]